MGWIKRNLFFVVGALLALGLLGGAGFFIYTGWSHNTDASQSLDELYGKLKELSTQSQQPGNERMDNVKLAREQEQQLQDWIKQAMQEFSPIPPIPQGEVTSKTYATALGATVYQLQQEAKEAGINLPPQYNFSFQAQSSQLTISSGLGPLAQQLGEVKAITEVLFAARVNDLENLQRVRVSDEDTGSGSQSDYLDAPPITNDLAIITPYLVTFRSFTPELSKVIAGFAASPNLFIVKAIAVEPAGTTAASDTQAMGVRYMDPRMAYGRNPNYPYPYPPGGMPGQPPPAPAASKGGLQTVLKERLLRITLEVDIVKLLPTRS